MPITMVDDTLDEQLLDMYDAEHRFWALGQWTFPQVTDERLRATIKTHTRESQQQISNLERALRLLGVEPLRIRSQSAGRLVDEAQTSMRAAAGSPDGLDYVVAGVMARVERFEVERYHALVRAAEQMGNGALTDLLRGVLEQEEQALRDVEERKEPLAQHARLVKARAA
jgi:ferritin-like metal-binding protein YciE